MTSPQETAGGQGVSDELATDEMAPISADPVGEVRTLRAKIRILRAERTAIAGRKYVLETVVESLRQKLDELGGAFAMVQSGGDVAAAVKLVATIVRDARRIAEDKEAAENELDAERSDRLKERRSREAREFELEEKAAALSAEKATLLERLQAADARLQETAAAATQTDDLQRQLAALTAELTAAAHELERAATDAESRARELSEEKARREKAEREREDTARELDAVKSGHTKAQTEILNLRSQNAADDQAKSEELRSILSERGEHQRALEEARGQLELAARELERSVTESQIRAQEIAHEKELREKAEKERDDWHRELQELKAEREALTAEVHAASRGSDDAIVLAQEEAARALEVEKAEWEQKLAEAQAKLSEVQDQLENARQELAQERGEKDGVARALASAQADHAHALEREVQQRSSGLDGERKLREELAQSLQEELGRQREALAGSDVARKKLEIENVDLRQKLAQKTKDLEQVSPELDDLKKKFKEQQPVLDALADRVEDLEKENQKLLTRLGEARSRGRVDVNELLVRAALLKRREAREKAGKPPLPEDATPAPRATTASAAAPARKTAPVDIKKAAAIVDSIVRPSARRAAMQEAPGPAPAAAEAKRPSVALPKPAAPKPAPKPAPAPAPADDDFVDEVETPAEERAQSYFQAADEGSSADDGSTGDAPTPDHGSYFQPADEAEPGQYEQA